MIPARPRQTAARHTTEGLTETSRMLQYTTIDDLNEASEVLSEIRGILFMVGVDGGDRAISIALDAIKSELKRKLKNLTMEERNEIRTREAAKLLGKLGGSHDSR